MSISQGRPFGWLTPSTKNKCGVCNKGTIVKTKAKGMVHMSMLMCNNCGKIYKLVGDLK